MDLVKWIALAVAIGTFVKGSDYGRQYKKSKGDDGDCIRDSMVIMKNPLVIRGFGTALLTILLAASSDGWGTFRFLALAPMVALGVILFWHFPAKVRTKLQERGNDDFEIACLRKAFALYSVTIATVFLGFLAGEC